MFGFVGLMLKLCGWAFGFGGLVVGLWIVGLVVGLPVLLIWWLSSSLRFVVLFSVLLLLVVFCPPM